MDTTFRGSDVDALHGMATRCADAAQQIIDLYLRTTATLHTRLAWFGPDAMALRTQWDEQVATGMLHVAGALREAGLQLAKQAEEQLAASTDGGTLSRPISAPGSGGAASGSGGAASGGAPAGAEAGDWAGRVRAVRDVLMQLPGAGMLARMAKEFPADLFPSAANDMRTANGAYAATLAKASGLERVGLEGLGVAGTVMDAHGLVTAVQDGDLTDGVQSGVSLGITGATAWGALGAATGAAAGVSWGVGSAIGDAAYEGMQGTRYGDIVEEMARGAFEENGAAGMAQVPGILGFAAWEYFTEDRPEQTPGD